jgi:DnaJ-class molecular chaperone
MVKDYYTILNLEKNATLEEIKKSYKKLALQFHPDKNQGNEEATEKFKEVSEAYSVLSNDDKRRQYNVMGSADDDFDGFDGMEDPFAVFNSIFKQHLSSFMNMQYDKDINISNIFSNLSGVSQDSLPFGNVHIRVHTFPTDVFEINQQPQFFNLNDLQQQQHQYENNNYSEKIHSFPAENIIYDKPADINEKTVVSFADIYNKLTKKINISYLRKKNGSYIKKKKSIEIPIYGKEVFLEGFGNEAQNYKNRGDVIINIFTKKSKKFKRINEYDMLVYHEIELNDIYKNNEFKIKLPHGEMLNIKTDKLFENSENQLIQKVIGKGIPYKNNDENTDANLDANLDASLDANLDANLDASLEEWLYGDLYIVYKVKFPVLNEKDSLENSDNINAVNCSINDILKDD